MKSRGLDSVQSWLVVLLCTGIHTLSLTPYRLVGLMFVSLIESYNTDRRTASIPIFLFMTIRCAGGPFYGMLGQRFGVEKVGLVGTFIAAIGIGGCAIIPDIRYVIVFLGLVYGFGLGCCNANVPSIIKKHFTRNVSTANGLVNAGSCIGAAIVPPVAYFALHKYGVAGTFLIVSGVMLNAVPMAMLVIYASISQAQVQMRRSQYCDQIVRNQHKKTSKAIIFGEIKPEQYSALKTDEGHPRKQTIGSLDCTVINSEVPSEEKFNEDFKSPFFSKRKSDDNNILQCANIKIENENDLFKSEDILGTKPVLQENNKSVLSLAPIISTKQENNILPSTREPRKGFFSLEAFKEASLIAIMLNVALHTYITTLTWTTMLDYSRDKGISKDKEMYFLMLQPMFDFLGRIGFGWVTDLGYLTIPKFTVLGYIMMTISTGCVVLSKSFGVMLSSSLIFSLSSGSISTMFPGMIYKYVTDENQTVAQASRYFLFGFLAFTSSAVIGFFRINLGSYDGLYYFIMVICMVSCLIIPLMLRFSKVVKKRDEELKI